MILTFQQFQLGSMVKVNVEIDLEIDFVPRKGELINIKGLGTPSMKGVVEHIEHNYIALRQGKLTSTIITLESRPYSL